MIRVILWVWFPLFIASCAMTNGFTGDPSPSHAWEETHR